MRDAAPQVINLKDYTPPAFLISTVALDVDIQPAQATIRAVLKCARNAARNAPGEPLVLDGDGLELVSVAIDGRALAEGEYRVDETHLTIAKVPESFTLETVVRFDPWKNTKLEGLYATKAGLVTQCEAEGFRRITYFIDRPDVMATYAVTLCADKAQFPRLLANGNLVAQGDGEPASWFQASPRDEPWTTSSPRASTTRSSIVPGRQPASGLPAPRSTCAIEAPASTWLTCATASSIACAPDTACSPATT